MATKLHVVPEPLTDPVGRGRVILHDQAIPMRGDNPLVELVCGSCDAPLVLGLDLINFRVLFGDAEILLRCNRCHAYNDVTPPPQLYDLDFDLLDHIKSLLSHARRARNALFPQFQPLGLQDPRIMVAEHLLTIASAAFLNLIHVKDNLRHAGWWEHHGFGAAVTAGVVPELLGNYMVLNTASLMFFSFSLFESGIRRLVRALDPTACSYGGAAFKNIYDWLFAYLQRHGWSYSAGNPSAFLDLYRIFRNTLHNNGAFYPPSGRDEEVIWRGAAYRFQYATVPDFYGWEFNLLLLRELVSVNHAIMSADSIAQLPAIP